MNAGAYIVHLFILIAWHNHFLRIKDAFTNIFQFVDGHLVVVVAHNAVVSFLEVFSVTMGRRCSMGML